MHLPVRPLLSGFLAAALLSGAATAAPPPVPPAEVPPPPAIDDPGVTTPRDAAAQPGTAPVAPVRGDDPLAPLPKPDSRLVRDKASRQAAAERERVAASEVTTRRQGSDTVEEFRQNGQLWMIRIHPAQGPVQTFYSEGPGGRLMRNPNEGPIAPVYYTLYEWK